MKNLLFTYTGRINRAKMWYAMLIHFIVAAVVGIIMAALWAIIPGTYNEATGYSVDGVRAIPYIIVSFAYLIFSVWSGICVAIKRLHDRNKSGWFMLITLIPLIGSIWYLLETLVFKGTTGPNFYGEDPLAVA